jgi:tRNA(fMet)-specific endonuclease VapC
LASIPVVPFDADCEHKLRELQALALRIGTQDLKIASIAVVNDLVLVTRNQRDFGRVPALRLEDWSINQ